MENKAVAELVHLIPAGMLVLALGRWPYGYYMLLRVVVLAAALLIAGLIYQRAKPFTLWLGLFVVVAVIFNPIVPLHPDARGVVHFEFGRSSIIRRALGCDARGKAAYGSLTGRWPLSPRMSALGKGKYVFAPAFTRF